MLVEILNIVAPVFLVIAAGYLAVRSGIANIGAIDQLMQFAIPCLLFRATSTIDLDVAFGWRMMLAYYLAATTCFIVAFLVVKNIFKRRSGEAVGVAFAAMFSNLVMLGLPISERAWAECLFVRQHVQPRYRGGSECGVAVNHAGGVHGKRMVDISLNPGCI